MSSTITVVDYGVGNLASIANMIKKAGGVPEVTSEPGSVASAAKLVLPGVGAFDECARRLATSGLESAVRVAVDKGGAHLLGICVGFQLLSRGSEEGSLAGLGWLEADTVQLRPNPAEPLKTPHMGWAEVSVKRDTWMFDPQSPSRFYFLHSYHVECAEPQDVAATAVYGRTFVAAATKGRISGVQFHPEKSHRYGLGLFRRYLELG
jgi:imidazole glycerol-phosphate synthase subunit HisH